MTGSLRDKRAEQRQARRSACAKHPEKVLIHRTFGLWCNECHAVPKALTRVLSETKRYLQGDKTQSAAIISKLNDKYGEGSMTEEQNTAIAVVRATPPDIMPSYEEAERLTKQFTGWSTTKDGKEIKPSMATAVAIHGLLKMGVLPVHINILGGNSVYVTLDGFIAHAQAVIEQRGEKWGRIVYTTNLTDDEKERIGDLANKPGVKLLKATYQKEVLTSRSKEYPDGSVETWQEPTWFDVQSALGHGDPQADKQPVERQFPERMAEARSTRRVLRLMAGIKYPQAVGVLSDVGIIEEPEIPAQPINVLEAGDVEPAEVLDFNNPHELTDPVMEAGLVEADITDTEPRPRKKVSLDLAKLTVEKIKERGVDSVDDFVYEDETGQPGVMAMLKAGYTADQVAQAVAEVCKPAKVEPEPTVKVEKTMGKPKPRKAKEPTTTYDPETNEVVEEL